MKRNIGSKFYTYINDELVVLRLQRIKNNDCFVMRKENGETIKLTNKELNEYVKINPDGYFTVSHVKLEQNMDDVIITLHRLSDIKDSNDVPYCVCRQSILDVFANQIVKDKIMYVGVSISVDTCPADVPYNITTACNGILDKITVEVYMDDTLSTILSYISLNKYDNILKQMNSNVVGSGIIGYCMSVQELLEDNCFMYDFHKAFNITEIQGTVKDEKLSPEQIINLEDELKHIIVSYVLVKYSKEIDFNDITGDYILLIDKTDTLYIMGYIKGEYVNRGYSVLDDRRDAIMMIKNKKHNIQT